MQWSNSCGTKTSWITFCIDKSASSFVNTLLFLLVNNNVDACFNPSARTVFRTIKVQAYKIAALFQTEYASSYACNASTGRGSTCKWSLYFNEIFGSFHPFLISALHPSLHFRPIQYLDSDEIDPPGKFVFCSGNVAALWHLCRCQSDVYPARERWFPSSWSMPRYCVCNKQAFIVEILNGHEFVQVFQ